MRTLQTILVPLDGSPPSLAALDYAIALANDYDAALEVLNVVPPQDPLSASARAALDRTFEDAVDRACESLGGRVVSCISVGEPVREIVSAARHVDLIVIGTHGRVGRLHELLGSVAEGVVRNAPCPVLTVRDTTTSDQSFAERRHGRPSVSEDLDRGARHL